MNKAALVGKRIKFLRMERGLSQVDIANTVGVNRSHLSAIESGRIANPGLFTIERIAKALKVSISYLLHFDERSLKRRVLDLEKRKKERKKRTELLEQREREIKKLKKQLRNLKKRK